MDEVKLGSVAPFPGVEDDSVLVWDELDAFYGLKYPETYARAIDVLEAEEW